MKKQNIEDIFSSMENFSSVPPPELWSQIEEKLDQPKKKKKAILWWSAAACLLLGLMLPSVLHFNSTSEIKTIKNGSVENNGIVLDEKKNNTNSNPAIQNKDNGAAVSTTQQKSNGTVDNPSLKNNTDPAGLSIKNQNQKTAVAQADASNKTNSENTVPNSTVTKRKENQTTAEKAIVSAKTNTYQSNQSNAFNSVSKNQFLNTERKATHQNLGEKTYVYGKTNGFNPNSKNQLLSADKKAANQILAEKTFNAGKTNPFNSNVKNQVSGSVFEEQPGSKNNFGIALNTPGSLSSNNPKTSNENAITGRELTGNSKNNSKFTAVLSKQDSVQLAELQNLEKGIISPENKKEKEEKTTIPKGEKWAVEVFAGVASSENYKNDKTLGNVNDSKQGNTYGVKTKYKINKKWAVGSGFKINELGQSVADVSYISNGPPNTFMTSNDYFNQNATVVAASPQISTNTGYIFVSKTTTNALKQNNIESNTIESGNLDQSLRYIEMPLEVSYSVFSRNKTTINLNTGGFVGKLISNNMALNGNSIGKNVNANDYIYGSTLSSTLQYRVYKKTSVFVEPAMNYYINPLNSQSFNQFQWGLNFGLNVSF
ncbi:hypothetical protein [Flavobacterium collinsii]|uniref:Outer membrane protein beta-barrel domain-containing protein n=1 Tax=Flavobacterium collinsii TaxID=1114861 RepID=A0A9W4X822_9FLAO|nr:hypothetical protein [Flavobacterium collinsii]CAI2765180.1 conserved protein of unknown function [Flavobacterium collinsii]